MGWESVSVNWQLMCSKNFTARTLQILHTWANAYGSVGQTSSSYLAGTSRNPAASASQPRPSKKRCLTGPKDEPVTAEERSAQPFARLNLSKNEPARKKSSSDLMDDVPAAFNVFRKRDFTEVMRADHFKDAAAAQTWIAGMQGEIKIWNVWKL